MVRAIRNEHGEEQERGIDSERVPRSSPRRKVMVVDDSELVLEVTKGMLRSAGFDVITCDSPIGAVLRVVQEKPDVVLVDLDMASMGGDRLILALKQGPRTAHIPVCLYTSQDPRIAQEAVRRSRADGFIAKGCDPLLLAHAVRRAMAR